MPLTACVRPKHILSLNCFLPILWYFFSSPSPTQVQENKEELQCYAALQPWLLLCLRGRGTRHPTPFWPCHLQCFPGSSQTQLSICLPGSTASLSNKEAVISLNTAPKSSFSWCSPWEGRRWHHVSEGNITEATTTHQFPETEGPWGYSREWETFFFTTDVYWFVQFIGSIP